VTVTTQVIVLNGGSSSGKATIARRLQEALPRPWIRMGVAYDLMVDTSRADAEECARLIGGAVA
jgi:chloramphenicol 3-O phosphotransferase